jgi:hypothetical protein
MTAVRVLAFALLAMLVMLASPVSADPITDPGSVNTGSPYDTSLVDGSGLPFLLTGTPTYLQLPSNDSNAGGDGGSDAPGGPGGTDPGGPFYSPLFFGPSESTETGLFSDFTTGPDTGDDTNNSIFEFLGLGETPEEDGPNNFPRIQDDLPQTSAVPEPAMMLLVGAGLTAAFRRRARVNGTV